MKTNKLATIAVLALTILHSPFSIVHAATGCNFPASLDSFTDKSAGDFLTVANVNTLSCAVEAVEAAIGATGSLKFATLLGLSGGQTLNGATGASGALKLSSTANATKGLIWLGTASTLGAASAYDEVNVRLGIGSQAPTATIHAAKDGTTIIQANSAGTGNVPTFLGQHARGTLASPTASQSGDILAALTASGYGASAYSSQIAYLAFKASENFTDSAQGTYFEVAVTPATTTTAAIEMILNTAGLRIGDAAFADTTFHAGLINNHAAMTFEESTANPNDPTSAAQMRIYMKRDKFVIQYNDGGTVRYKTLDLTGTGTSWAHSTTPP